MLADLRHVPRLDEAAALVDRLQAAYLAAQDPQRQARLRRLVGRAQVRYLRRCAPRAGRGEGFPVRRLSGSPLASRPPRA